MSDDRVPYELLDSEPVVPTTAESTATSGPAPLVFWVTHGDRLVPSAAEPSCDEEPEEVAERLLAELARGPGEAVREAGRSTAIPSETDVGLTGITEGQARVEIEAGPAVSAERLPVAVGQIVLTLVSVAGVRSVVLVSDGQPVQVPLPGGALTGSPVAADDYQVMLPERFQGLGTDLGCPEP